MYAIAKLNYSGNDDASVQGFLAKEVKSIADWEKKIRSGLESEFEESDYMELYYSDNNSTPFASVDEVMGTFTIKKITKAEYETLVRIFGTYSRTKEVRYGHVHSYLTDDGY